MNEYGIPSATTGKYTCGGNDPSRVIYISTGNEGFDYVYDENDGKGMTYSAHINESDTGDSEITWIKDVIYDQYLETRSDWAFKYTGFSDSSANEKKIITQSYSKGSNALVRFFYRTEEDLDVYRDLDKKLTSISKAKTRFEDAIRYKCGKGAGGNDYEPWVFVLRYDEGNMDLKHSGDDTIDGASKNDLDLGKVRDSLVIAGDMYEEISEEIKSENKYNVVTLDKENPAPDNLPIDIFTAFDPDDEHYLGNYISVGEIKNMSKDKLASDECVLAVWPTNDSGLVEGEPGYDPDEDGELILSLLIRRTTADENFDFSVVLYESFSVKRMEALGYSTNDEENVCSNMGGKKCCEQCRRYVRDIIKGLKKIKDGNYSTYVPYIARVVGSWFRDTYFVIPDGIPNMSDFKSADSNGELKGLINDWIIKGENIDFAIAYAAAEYPEYKYNDLCGGSYGDLSLIKNDEAFLDATGELWTEYISDAENKDYALFVINPDGSYWENNDSSTVQNWKDYYPDLPEAVAEDIYNSITTLRKEDEDGKLQNYYGYIDVTYEISDESLELLGDKENENSDDETENSDKEEPYIKTKSMIERLFKAYDISYIKRAKTQKADDLNSADNEFDGWSAYGFSTEHRPEKKALDINNDTPNAIRKIHDAYNFGKEESEIENIFWYELTTDERVVTQTEDGQRGITNEKIKYLFKNKKYYKYDGTILKAYNIKDDWRECLDLIRNNTDEYTEEMLKENLKSVARFAVRTALFGPVHGGLFQNFFDQTAEDDELQNEDDIPETVLNGYIDAIYYDDEDTLNEFDDFVFIRDFDDDGIADLASRNLKNDLDIGEYYNSKGEKLDESDTDAMKITEGTKYSNDPRNPDLINKVDLTTESLTAFSILENTHTADADYAYRDLKELFCELDYFDKEDLTEPATDILEWILPESGSYGWPNKMYDKENEFGSLIHSKEMYENLNAIMTQSVNNPSDTQMPSIEVPADTSIEDENATAKLEINYDELQSFARVSSRNTVSKYIVPTDTVAYDNFDETGYTTIVEVNGLKYPSYKQYIGPYSGNECSTNRDDNGNVISNGTISSHGCGPTSLSIILNAYGIKTNPGDVVNKLGGSSYCLTWDELSNVSSEYGVEFNETVSISNDGESMDNALAQLRTAFEEGKPALILVGMGKDPKGYGYTDGGHYMVAIGEDEDGHIIIINCGSGKFAGFEDTGYTTEEFLDYYMSKSNNPNDSDRGFMVPVEAPIGFYSTAQDFNGFEPNQPIVSPATAKVLEIGTVEVRNENEKNILKRFYIADEVSEDIEEDEPTGKSIVVTQEQYDNISEIAKNLEEDTGNSFGKTYTTGYIKLEVIGSESMKKFEELKDDSNNLFDTDTYNGFQAFYEEYYNANNNKTICDSYTIYIEGVDLTGTLEEDGTLSSIDDTILGKIFNEKNTQDMTSLASEIITTGTVTTSDGMMPKTTDTADDTDTEISSNSINLSIDGTNTAYQTNYYTEREAPKYYMEAAREKIKIREENKQKLASIIKIDKEIYIKAGTLIGVTGDANINIIMKDKDEGVVENIEEYLEIDDISSANAVSNSARAGSSASEYYLAWHIQTYGQMAIPACGTWYDNYGTTLDGEKAEFTNDDTGVVPNLMPELAMIDGGPNVIHLGELGYDTSKLISFNWIKKYPVKIEDVIDTYYLYINNAAEDIKNSVNGELMQYQLDALIETYIWGQAYTHKLIDIYNANGELTESDFVNLSTYSTITEIRKKIAYRLFNSDDFGEPNGYFGSTSDIDKRAVFKTDTPFSDMVYNDALGSDVMNWE